MPYTAGQPVEILAHDFTRRDCPVLWQSGEVTEVLYVGNGFTDVSVRLASGALGVERVGPRGGNRKLRPAGAAAAH